jgi:hypothetical protein
MIKEKKKIGSISIDPLIKELMQKEARLERRTFSAMVELVLYNHLKSKELI